MRRANFGRPVKTYIYYAVKLMLYYFDNTDVDAYTHS